MHYLLPVVALSGLFAAVTAYAQPAPAGPPRKIEVTGSAEREIIPDKIYFLISLKEYEEGRRKVTLGELEKQLQQAVRRAGLDADRLRVGDVQGYRQWWRKKPEETFFASKQYRLELDAPDKINQVLAALDDRAIERTDVAETSHSQIEQMRREIKVEAIKAAREKAGYLLAALGEEVGPVLEIQEINNDYGQPQPRYANMMMMESADADAPPPVEFRKIKLVYEVRTVFGIK